jgi:hypothetical protein
MAQIPIPEPWRKAVCAVLATEARNLIDWTIDAAKDYDADATATKMRADDPDPAWQNEVYGPFRDALSNPSITGCPVTMASPPGETYEFYFKFKHEWYYGKILLRPDKKQIVIFSAHRPRKAKLICE